MIPICDLDGWMEIREGSGGRARACVSFDYCFCFFRFTFFDWSAVFELTVRSRTNSIFSFRLCFGPWLFFCANAVRFLVFWRRSLVSESFLNVWTPVRGSRYMHARYMNVCLCFLSIPRLSSLLILLFQCCTRYAVYFFCLILYETCR